MAKKNRISIILTKGGPGSGHRGHSGRPGKRGGSMPGIGDGNKVTENIFGGKVPKGWKSVTISGSKSIRKNTPGGDATIRERTSLGGGLIAIVSPRIGLGIRSEKTFQGSNALNKAVKYTEDRLSYIDTLAD